MAVRPIVNYPAPVLRQKSEEISVFDDALETLVEDMIDTMFDAPGIGLAANQVGVALRVAVVDAGGILERDTDDASEEGEGSAEVDDPPPAEHRDKVLCLVNPQITAAAGYIEFEEGCLSLPGVKERVRRRAAIEVSAHDAKGTPIALHASGLLAVCIQHEIDHLDGVLFVDRLSAVRRELMKSKLKRLFPGTK
jgi:peptide deformylase